MPRANGRGFSGSQIHILPGVYCRRLISDATRRQPTIRLAVSDFWGIRQVTVCRVAQTLNPGTYACRGSNEAWSPWGLSGGVMLRSCVRCDIVVAKRKSQIPAASRRPPWGGEAIERRPASLTSGDCSPEPATSTFNSRLRKIVIAGRLRTGQVSAQLCQERVRPLFFLLAPSRERRLNDFCRELWRLSTWRQKHLHRGWPGQSRQSHEFQI